MGFRAIFWKTFIDLTAWKRTLVLMVIPVALLILILTYSWQTGDWPAEMTTHYALNKLLLSSFFWFSGFLMAFIVIANAAGFIAREKTEGTMLILASKPINRRDIVLSKFVAMVARAALLEAVLLLLTALLLRLILHLPEDTFVALLKAVLWILPYSLVVIIFFGAIATLFSSLTRNLIPIMVILSCLIMFCFLLGPVIRSSMQLSDGSSYVKYHLYSFDLSYHLNNAFVTFQEQASGGAFAPQFAEWISSNSILPMFNTANVNNVNGFVYYPIKPLAYSHPVGSVAVLLVVAGAALVLSVYAVKRKDIQ